MGRFKKITAAEVLEILTENQSAKSEIAKILNVCTATVGSRIRELRESGEVIIHNGDGLMLINKEKIENDEEVADSLRWWMEHWFLPLRDGLVTCAKPVQFMLPTLRRTLRESLSSSERKELSHSCIKIKALLDYAQAEAEDETE